MEIISTALLERCEGKCELCQKSDDLRSYTVPPKTGETIDEQVALCSTCAEKLSNESHLDPDYWRCLNDAIWSHVPAVQVTSYRLIKGMTDQPWAQDLIGMVYLDEETQEWAEKGQSNIAHIDSNGNVLQNGDSVILIKDLDVKGANFTAKRGTLVKKIYLVEDNPEQIEGKVNDQQIVILTKYVKKG
ncbi:MAG: PhnA domain-containing protein [Saprospiraceae bacterium]